MFQNHGSSINYDVMYGIRPSGNEITKITIR